MHPISNGEIGPIPGGSEVKNPPTSAGETGLTSDLGRSLMPQSIRPSATTFETVL